MILYALTNVLRERQAVHGRLYPTDSDWIAINRAIAATGFKADELSRPRTDEWQATLDSALRVR